MTNKEFFIETLKDEAPRFKKAIEALPDDKHDYKVHERSRTAGNLAAQLAVQWKAISGILTAGQPNFDPHEMEKQTKDEMLAKFDQGIAQMQKDLEVVSDEEWENGQAAMGENWKDKKYRMAWGFLFDAIHHRGQLATFLRAMGSPVPSIYGPSADDPK
ncbi:DinB family protein [Candidatus Parcubacteria bacterium]|nr:DinB family protein [Candidatus Parcubacteria bacterium]